jgi:hypothetical protein
MMRTRAYDYYENEVLNSIYFFIAAFRLPRNPQIPKKPGLLIY